MIKDQQSAPQPATPERPQGAPWTIVLLVAYFAVFVAEVVVFRYFRQDYNVFNYLSLSRAGLAHGYVWQLVTYQFMHANWVHLFFNGWFIFLFGREMEKCLGGLKYLVLVFASGIVGGLFQFVASILWPGLFGGAVVGASACAFGLVAAFATLYPEEELDLVLLVYPVVLRAKTLFTVFIIVGLAGFTFQLGNIAHAAHLGGMAMGWFYVTKILNLKPAAGSGAPPAPAAGNC